MTRTAGGAFGFASGLIIQEFGYDEDVDEALRQAVETETGTGLVDEDYEDVADSALIWWRHDDGDVDDLTDLLVDAQANLDGDGLLWVLTPKARTTGAVPTSEIEEAAGARRYACDVGGVDGGALERYPHLQPSPLSRLREAARRASAAGADQLESGPGSVPLMALCGPRTCSSVGRAMRLHRIGRRFESGRVHRGLVPQ